MPSILPIMHASSSATRLHWGQAEKPGHKQLSCFLLYTASQMITSLPFPSFKLFQPLLIGQPNNQTPEEHKEHHQGEDHCSNQRILPWRRQVALHIARQPVKHFGLPRCSVPSPTWHRYTGGWKWTSGMQQSRSLLSLLYKHCHETSCQDALQN